MTDKKDITNTRFKLNEASFFLARLKENTDDIEKFLFYLSAHLTAQISIIDAMKYEFNRPKRREFGDWFYPKDTELQSNGFEELNCLRIAVVHLAGNLAKKIKRGQTGTVVMQSGNITYSTTNSAKLIEAPEIGFVNNTWVWQFKGNRQPVLYTCEYFLNMLSKIVEECETKFYVSSST